VFDPEGRLDDSVENAGGSRVALSIEVACEERKKEKEREREREVFVREKRVFFARKKKENQNMFFFRWGAQQNREQGRLDIPIMYWNIFPKLALLPSGARKFSIST